MRKYLFFILLSLLSPLFHSQVKNPLNIPPNAKIGLSLAGGGAKGFAHIGALKVIDSLGIKIDYVSGTSMGAIVGGLYASGYSAKDIEKIVKETDFYNIIANEKNRQEASLFSKSNDKYLLNIPIRNGKFNVLPKAISTGQKNIYMLKELFHKVSNVEDFSKLPIPFMCIATNLENGNMQIFEKGDLVSSIMASSAYPGLIDPVKIGEDYYIDGAMTINYPSKPLKDKGIDIVIGVDLSQPLSKQEDLSSAVAILNQVIDFSIKKETLNQYQYTDINIHPDLKGYNSTSYGDKEKILSIGYEKTLEYVDTLKLLPKGNSTKNIVATNPIYSNVYKIDSLILENNRIFNKDYVQGKMNLKIPSLQTYGNINKMLDKLYSTNNYNLLNYDLIQTSNGNTLKLIVNEEDTRFFLKFGLHYDEVFKTGLLMNATIKRLLLRNSTLSLDVAVGGQTPRYYFNYFVDNGYIPGFGIYSSGMQLQLNDDNRNITQKWKWLRNEVFLQSIWKDKFAIGGGISYDYYDTKINTSHRDKQVFFNPYVFIKNDNRDDKDFATRGFSLDATGKLIDVLDKDRKNNQILQIQGKFQFNFPVSKTFTYRMNLFGGFTLGENLPQYYQYFLGGIFEQNLGNFVAFPGYQFGNYSRNNLVLTGNDFQFKIKKNYFLIAHLNAMNTFDIHQPKYIFKIQDISTGITAGYKSPFGQIKLNYSRAFDKKRGIISVILGHWF